MVRIGASLLIGAILIAGPAAAQTVAGNETRILSFADVTFGSHRQTRQPIGKIGEWLETKALMYEDLSNCQRRYRACETTGHIPNRRCTIENGSRTRSTGEPRPNEAPPDGRGLKFIATWIAENVSKDVAADSENFRPPYVCCRPTLHALTRSIDATQ